MAGDITALAFMLARLPLLEPGHNSARDGARKQDRTVKLVRRWVAVSDALKIARASTLACLEASETKAGSVNLRGVDRRRFDAIQAQIADLAAELEKLEAAIVRLDEMGGLWWDALYNQHSTLSLTPSKMSKRINDEAAQIIHRSGKPLEEALQDPEFLKRKAILGAEIANAQAELEKLGPKLKEIDGILKAVGC